MKKARDLVNFISKSNIATEKLKKAQKDANRSTQLKIVTDVVTRWWSTYSMVLRMIELKQFLQAMFILQDLSSRLEITDNDWVILTDVCSLLKPFKVAQEGLEGEKYISVHSSQVLSKCFAINLRS